MHLLEHGAIIGWTNGLSKPDLKAVEDEFNDIYGDGYYQLATVENPDLDVPFALSAWGAVQKCATVDTSVIRPFVEQWYASPKTRRERGRLPGRRARARQLLRAEAEAPEAQPGPTSRYSSAREKAEPRLRPALERVDAAPAGDAAEPVARA